MVSRAAWLERIFGYNPQEGRVREILTGGGCSRLLGPDIQAGFACNKIHSARSLNSINSKEPQLPSPLFSAFVGKSGWAAVQKPAF